MIRPNLSPQMPMEISHEIATYLPREDKSRFLCVIKGLNTYTNEEERVKIKGRWSTLFAQYSVCYLKQNPFAIYPLPDTNFSPDVNPLPEILTRCTWYGTLKLQKEMELHLTDVCKGVAALDNSEDFWKVIKLAKQVPTALDKTEVDFPWQILITSITEEAVRLWTDGNKEQALEKIYAIHGDSHEERNKILCAIAEKFIDQDNFEALQSLLDLVPLTSLKDGSLHYIVLEYVKLEKIDIAWRAANAIARDDGCHYRSLSLYSLCSHFLSSGRYPTARKIAYSIQKNDLKYQVLLAVCRGYLRFRDYDTAIDVASSLPNREKELERDWKNEALFLICINLSQMRPASGEIEQRGSSQRIDYHSKAIELAVSISDKNYQAKALAIIILSSLVDVDKARRLANLISEDSTENRILKTYLLYAVAMVYLKKDDCNTAMDVANTMLEEEISNDKVRDCLHCASIPDLASTLIQQVSRDFPSCDLKKLVSGKNLALYGTADSFLKSGNVAMATSIANSFQDDLIPKSLILEKILLEHLIRKDKDNLLGTCSALFKSQQCLIKLHRLENVSIALLGNRSLIGNISQTILEKVIPKLLEDNEFDTAIEVADLIPLDASFCALAAMAFAMIADKYSSLKGVPWIREKQKPSRRIPLQEF